MAEPDKRGRLGRCRSWEEVRFFPSVSNDDLAEKMNALARAGWLVYDPEEEAEDVGEFGNQTYTIKATRDWCICGETIDPDVEV